MKEVTDTLDNMMFAVMASIPRRLAEDFAQQADVGYTLMDDWMNDVLTISVKQRIFGKQILYEEISYPADWKQAFKERWFPTWAKSRWPVRYTKKTFDVKELVPSLAIPNHKSFIYTQVSDY